MLVVGQVEIDPSEFWSRVKKGPGCWEWSGYRDLLGYGVIKKNGRRVKAHRVAYWITFGPAIKPFICHHCDNPSCVRPDHLFEGTSEDNNRDRDVKGRHGVGYTWSKESREQHWLRRKPWRARGEGNPNVKLSDKQVAEIRRRFRPRAKYGLDTTGKLAKEFGVTSTTIRAIGKGLSRC